MNVYRTTPRPRSDGRSVRRSGRVDRVRSVACFVAAIAASFASAIAVAAQGVVVDQGQFQVTIDGRAVGTEDFVIRRASLGSGAAFFANGVIAVTVGDSAQQVRPLLRAMPPDGFAESYQVEVVGADALELRLALSGRRYVATIRSPLGDEDREFPARPETRIIDHGVAHHYYFVRDLRVDRDAPVLEPRARRQYRLRATARSEAELRVGPNVVQVRRVDFETEEGEVRTVWYDRQGRVVRVEVPVSAYVAQRTDLIG